MIRFARSGIWHSYLLPLFQTPLSSLLYVQEQQVDVVANPKPQEHISVETVLFVYDSGTAGLCITSEWSATMALSAHQETVVTN